MTTQETPSRPPLEGIAVLDFTQTLAGPHCTWLLSCLGADVTKLEPPGGDYSRGIQNGHQFANTNRNKRSAIADLKSPDGLELAMSLARTADVLVENYKPGVMRRFGLSYDDVSRVNPSIVYASISGFGQDGPYSDRPGYDALAQAMSGMMAATGEESGPPVRVGTAPIDYGTGVYTALAITAALYRRRETGEGAYIDASLLETAMAWMSFAYTHYSNSGEVPRRLGSANESFVPYQVFEALDGHVFVGVATDPMFARFCEAFGLTELADDERFRTIAGRCAHRDQVVNAVTARLAEMRTAEILDRLRHLEIPATEVFSVDRILEDPHVQARRAVVSIEDPHFGTLTVTPFPVKMTGVPRSAGKPAPGSGEHTDEIRREVGLD